MLVRVTRTASALLARALFYAALFVFVVVVHLWLTGVLKERHWDARLAFIVSGAVVLALVLFGLQIGEWIHQLRASMRERARARQGLPVGPCCVLWQPEQYDFGPDMPWEIDGPVRARYPRLARRLGVEGYAVAEFEVAAGGRAKNIHLVDAWPSDVFFEAAREALQHAQFTPKGDVHVRFGASYRLPFVFRISGASKLRETGRRARQLRPMLHAAGRAVDKLRDSSEGAR